MMEYTFGIKDDGEIQAIVLADNTHIVLTKKDVLVMFPKKKFTEIFQQQIEDNKKDFIGISFSEVELEAIMEGMDALIKRKNDKAKAHKKIGSC